MNGEVTCPIKQDYIERTGVHAPEVKAILAAKRAEEKGNTNLRPAGKPGGR